MEDEVINTIFIGDCREQMKTIPDNSISAVITDPPYELGFMGKAWDKSGIAYDPQVWQQVFRVLKPGGYLLSFGGTRTYHRMAVAIEDAGFEIRDMVEWVYGSGFPKSLNIGKAVDKLQGNKREIVGEIRAGKTAMGQNSGWNDHANRTVMEATKGTSAWEGWGTALKPAHEPICMARKPLSEKTVAENVLKHGTGGINIDGSRVGIETITVNRHSGYNSNSLIESTKGKWKGEQEKVSGRFPANLIHDGSEEVVGMFPQTKSGKLKSDCYEQDRDNNSIFAGGENFTHKGYEADSGSAARFFYCAKASKEERNRGCEDMEEKRDTDRENDSIALSNRLHNKTNLKNNHPTVKPIALMKYLIGLVTPPNGIVLDPFCGSGSTLVACKELHVSYIGIELDAEYVTIAQKRIEGARLSLF